MRAPAATYPIRAVARMTGISLDRLRAWERRYQAVTPLRGGRGRVYDDNDVARLRQLARLVDAGHAIGSIATLPNASLARLVDRATEPRSSPPDRPPADFDTLSKAVRQYDLPAVETLLNRYATLLAPDVLIFAVLLPVLREVGTRWEAGSINPAQEHLISATIRSVLGGLLRTLSRAGDDEVMVFGTLSGERHELGVLAAAVLAAQAGREVIYLGPDVPGVDLAHAVRSLKARTLVVGTTMPEVSSVREVRSLRRIPPDVTVIAGGSNRSRVRRELGNRARLIDTLEQFGALMQRGRS
jgi:methanogenic corrinoid protein MtbC1